jgi:hypothetical protein
MSTGQPLLRHTDTFDDPSLPGEMQTTISLNPAHPAHRGGDPVGPCTQADSATTTSGRAGP